MPCEEHVLPGARLSGQPECRWGSGHPRLTSWGTLLLTGSKQAAEPSPETQGRGPPPEGTQPQQAGPLCTSCTHTGKAPPERRAVGTEPQRLLHCRRPSLSRLPGARGGGMKWTGTVCPLGAPHKTPGSCAWGSGHRSAEQALGRQGRAASGRPHPSTRPWGLWTHLRTS